MNMEVSTVLGSRSSDWKRRLVTTPALFSLAVGSLVVAPVLVPVAAIWDLTQNNRWSACRTLVFLPFFFWFEVLGLAVLFWLWLRHVAGMSSEAFLEANHRMQAWWVGGVFALVRRVYSIQLDVEGHGELNDPSPTVILSRHASTLDTLLPLALNRTETRFRYVLKAELLFDPALDYCGQRLPNAFVRRGSGNPEKEVARVVALGEDLGSGEAVVLFPEGTRFSVSRRRRLLEKFETDPVMGPVIALLQHTLPPLREGAVQLLAHTAAADVVFIAHRGLERARTMSDLIGGGLTGAHLEVCIWRVPAAEIPRDPESLRDFLLTQWRKVDRYVSERSLAISSTSSGEVSPL